MANKNIEWIARLASFSKVKEVNFPERILQQVHVSFSDGNSNVLKGHRLVVKQLARYHTPVLVNSWLELMQSHDVKIDVGCYTFAIRGLIENDKVAHDRNVHIQNLWRRLQEENVRPGLKMFSSIIEGYARNGEYGSCCHWVDQMYNSRVYPCILTFNSLLHCCAKNENSVAAEQWFRKLQQVTLKPDARTYGNIIETYTKQSDVKHSIRWLDAMERSGVERSATSYNLVLKMFADSGHFSACIAMIKKMVGNENYINPDLYSFNILLHALANMVSNDNTNASVELIEQEVENVFALMKKCSIQGDLYTYNSVLNIFAKSGHVEHVLKWFDILQQRGVQADLVSFHSVIDAYSRQGDISNAKIWLQKLLDAGFVANDTTQNLVLNAFAVSGDGEGAVEFLGEKVANNGMFQSVLHAFGKSGNVEGAEKVFKSFLLQCVPVDQYVCAGMLKCYAKVGEYTKAGVFISRMEQDFGIDPDVIHFQIVIDACAQAEKPKLAEGWFSKMCEGGNIVADTHVYNSLIYAFSHVGDLPNAVKWLDQMRSAGCSPCTRTYSSLAFALQKSPHVSVAKRLLADAQNERVVLDRVVYNSFIQAASTPAESFEHDAQKMSS